MHGAGLEVAGGDAVALMAGKLHQQVERDTVASAGGEETGAQGMRGVGGRIQPGGPGGALHRHVGARALLVGSRAADLQGEVAAIPDNPRTFV